MAYAGECGKRMARLKVLCVFGTRPETIKLAPVIQELGKHRDRVMGEVCVTAQHRQMLDQVLRLFEITPDYDLNVMEDNQSPTQVAAAVLARLEPILKKEQPDWVLVQGGNYCYSPQNWGVGGAELGARGLDGKANKG